MNQGDKGILKRWTYRQMKRRDELPALDHKLHQSHPPKGFGIFPQSKEHRASQQLRELCLDSNHKNKTLHINWKTDQ